jgi:hypothetical protein
MTYSSSFFDEIVQESLSSAKVVVPLVVDLVHPSSVVDVGCATGAWLSVFHDHGIKSILGLDGTYVDSAALLIPSDCFRSTDLAKPFSLKEEYDLALSLEVAEHLPEPSANSFVRSLCRLAPVIVFSAALPGQGGVHHVNEQWPEYWRQKFANENFRMFDPFRPFLWRDERVASHYRQNLFLYVHDDVLRVRPEFTQLQEVKDGNGLMLVEAHILFGLRATLKRLPHALWKTIRRRVLRVFPH